MAGSSGSTPPTAPSPDPNEKLVKVFESERESEALVVKGLLDSAGIDSDMTSVEAIQDMFPGVGGTVILVREEDAEQALQLIETYRQSPATDDETVEVDISEDSPTAG
jgi:Putative prokaryotic signal transducing protein